MGKCFFSLAYVSGKTLVLLIQVLSLNTAFRKFRNKDTCSNDKTATMREVMKTIHASTLKQWESVTLLEIEDTGDLMEKLHLKRQTNMCPEVFRIELSYNDQQCLLINRQVLYQHRISLGSHFVQNLISNGAILQPLLITINFYYCLTGLYT